MTSKSLAQLVIFGPVSVKVSALYLYLILVASQKVLQTITFQTLLKISVQ